MRSLFLLLAACIALPAAAQSSRGMTTERVAFAPGTVGATLSDGIARGETHRFLVGVQRGQTLRVDLSSDDGTRAEGTVRLQVYAPGRSIVARNAAPSSDGERFDLEYWTGTLSRSGDYQVVVYPAPGVRQSDYTLSITAE